MQFCASLPTFFSKNYDEFTYMLKQISQHYKFYCNYREIISEVYEKMHKRDTLSKFDCTRCQISSYMYSIFRNAIRSKMRDRQKELTRITPFYANSFEDSYDFEYEINYYGLHPTYENMLLKNESSNVMTGPALDLDRFRKYLTKIDAKKTGRKRKNYSLLCVFDLLYEGHTLKSIADSIDVSIMYVMFLVKKIKKHMIRFTEAKTKILV